MSRSGKFKTLLSHKIKFLKRFLRCVQWWHINVKNTDHPPVSKKKKSKKKSDFCYSYYDKQSLFIYVSIYLFPRFLSLSITSAALLASLVAGARSNSAKRLYSLAWWSLQINNSFFTNYKSNLICLRFLTIQWIKKTWQLAHCCLLLVALVVRCLWRR